MTTKPSSLEADRTRGVIRGYARVSTEYQARDGVSLETQMNAITGFATYKGYIVQEIVTDEGISGRTLEDRPNLISVLQRLKKKEHFVVHSLSRLARNVKETMEIYNLIKQRGAYFVTLDLEINTNTAMGRMVFQILASLAEFESNQISERVKENMATLIVSGKLITKPKYGWYSPGKGLQPLPHTDQQKSIEVIVNLYIGSNRLWTTSRIAKELNESKIPTHCRAAKWYPSRVRQILTDNLMNYSSVASDTDSESETESEVESSELPRVVAAVPLEPLVTRVPDFNGNITLPKGYTATPTRGYHPPTPPETPVGMYKIHEAPITPSE